MRLAQNTRASGATRVEYTEIEEMLYRKGVKELEIYDVACHLLGIKKMCETLENKYGLEYKYGIAKSLESFSYLWNITQETFRTDR